MITSVEKEHFLENVDYYTDTFYKNSDGKLFVKILSNFVHLTYPGTKIALDERMFTDKNMFKVNMHTILKAMLDLQTRAIVKTYTTGELAKFFGVSIMTINNWIDNKRFIGTERTAKNQKIKISDNVLWVSATTELIPIRAVVESWKSEQLKYVNQSLEEEAAAFKQTIKFFEEKYNGKYEDTLMKIYIKNSEQKRDEEEWKYLLERVKND